MATPPLALTDPLRARQDARRRRLRIGLPLFGVALVVAAILGIAVFVERANRAGVLALADDMLGVLQARVDQEVATFLEPVARATRLAAELGADAPLDAADAPALERLAAAILRDTPQVALFSLGDAAGNYTQVRRGAAGIDTKRIRNAPGPRRVTWIRRDAEGRILAEEEDPSDLFDARTRPWYRLAQAGQAVAWTEPYIFFTDRTPGVTVSAPVRGTEGVVGLDVTLAELSRFLGALQIGRSGQALILDREGFVVAARDPAAALRQDGDTLQRRRPDELGDPVLTRAFDMARLQPRLRAVFELGAIRHIVTAAPLGGEADQGWSLLITVPEEDFAGFVHSNGRIALLMSGGIVALTLLLATFLVRAGLRADRARRRMLEESAALAAQSAAFARIGSAAGLFEAGAPLPPAVLEELARVTGAPRAALWRLSADGRVLRCEAAHDRASGAQVSGAELHREELRPFFAALEARAPILLRDAAADPRTADLHRLWLHPLGSTALVAVPVGGAGGLLGALWVEDPAPEAVGVAEFCAAVANMLAPRLAEAVAPDAVAPAPRAAPAAAAAPGMADATLAPFLPRDLAADVYPDVAVLVLRFTDALALARRPAPDLALRLDQAACALQEIAQAQGLPYLKLLGEQVVAAAGFAGPGDDDAIERIATAALAIRQRCTELFEGVGGAPEFRIGLDRGMAIGTAVGTAAPGGQRVFNLWGEAVRGADEMAATALPGTVHATEAVYARLRQGFLLRPRGAFWMPRQGERRTYVLAGQL